MKRMKERLTFPFFFFLFHWDIINFLIGFTEMYSEDVHKNTSGKKSMQFSFKNPFPCHEGFITQLL